MRIACEVQHGILRWSGSRKVFSWTIAPRRVATFRSVLVPRGCLGGENLDQAVLGDFEYCCKLFEHRLLDILKAIQYRTDVVFGDAALRCKMGSIRNCVATTSPAILAFTARPLTGLDRFSQKEPTCWLPQGSSRSPSKSFRMLGLSVLVSAKRRLCSRLPKIRSSPRRCRSLENTGRQAR